jgi:hypothetical protein
MAHLARERFERNATEDAFLDVEEIVAVRMRLRERDHVVS